MKIKNYDCHQRRIFRMVRNTDISTQIRITTIKDSHNSGKKTSDIQIYFKKRNITSVASDQKRKTMIF